jgi:hypothetical protein
MRLWYWRHRLGLETTPMTNMTGGLRAPLSIHLEGPATERHRLPLHDVVLFADQLQTAIERVARLLTGRRISAQRGPLPSDIRRWCTLDLVEIKPGSVTLVCDLPQLPQIEQLHLLDDLGVEAVSTFVSGIGAFDRTEPVLPNGFDKGVLLALREAGKLLDHGVERIGFDFEEGDRRWSSHYTRPVHDRIVAQIQGPIEARRSVEGRLLAGDFKESGRRCRVHPPAGRPIECTFDEAQQQAVLAALTRYVRIVGEAQESDGQIRLLKLEDVEILDRDDLSVPIPAASGFFDPSPDLITLAANQQVKAITNFDDLLGDFWPDDETPDDFIAAVREWRRDSA